MKDLDPLVLEDAVIRIRDYRLSQEQIIADAWWRTLPPDARWRIYLLITGKDPA